MAVGAVTGEYLETYMTMIEKKAFPVGKSKCNYLFEHFLNRMCPRP